MFRLISGGRIGRYYERSVVEQRAVETKEKAQGESETNMAFVVLEQSVTGRYLRIHSCPCDVCMHLPSYIQHVLTY